MALKKSRNTKDGFVATDAYTVIDTIDYRKGRKVNAYASVYRDEAARDEGKGAIDGIPFDFELDTSASAKDIMAQAYAVLKALPEMESSEDVLE